MFWVRIITSMALPVLFSVLFHILETKTKFGKWSKTCRQVIIGVAFGVLACLATQFGIPYDDYVLNVRSAAPLAAGLLFGGPAGIIAGVIGALYRWFGVYWGVPTYTRLACSLATLTAGIIAAAYQTYLFDRKRPKWFYGMFIAMVTEVIHMLLIFLTHMDGISTAFDVVCHVAIPMIITNSVSVLLSILSVALISKEKAKTNIQPMTQIFAVFLFISVLFVFFATSTFTYHLQDNVSNMEIQELLSMNISDVEADIADALDRDLLERTENIGDSLKTNLYFALDLAKDGLRQLMYNLKTRENVSEINVVNAEGIVVVSTNLEYEGYDFNSNPTGQAAEFLCLLNGATSYVQEYQPTDYDSSVWYKYAAVSLGNGYFVQVGYNKEHFQEIMRNNLKSIANNRHIGQTGFIFVLDPDGENFVLSAPSNTVTNENVLEYIDSVSSVENQVVRDYETSEGLSYYYMKDEVEGGYIIIGSIPKEEAVLSRDMSVYIGAFMQLIAFFTLFCLVFVLLKQMIVKNIHKINQSLESITEGNLDTHIDIRDNEEFSGLSDGINTTVSRLKQYIDEAEKRIDQELAFARSIQLSAIPSVFPPFPNRHEFDLHAFMETAKEVGGDFYDFYLLGRNHLMFLIADVSGKGIPAAMFMMRAKTMIKSYAESGLEVADIFTRTNEKLCESNDADMFVTAWIGVLNLKTGVIKYANAGHNPPAIRRKDGQFELLKSRPGLVLAGMDGIVYQENQMQLQPGDELYLYTDGVTEATDKDSNLFGNDRLIATLNHNVGLDAKGLCMAVKKTIDDFVGEAPQFDDITMLSLKFQSYAQTEGDNP